MKLAIVSMAVGDFYNKISELTFPSLRKYAERVGADFIELQPNEVYKNFPHYLKCELNSVLDSYDRICYIDADIIVSPLAPNIFEKVPEDKMGLFEEGKYENRLSNLQNYFTQKGLNAVATQYFNTGVIVASKEHKKVFEVPEVFEDNFFEQTYLNYRIYKLEMGVVGLSYKFNRMTLADQRTGEHRLASYFVHYAGLSQQLPPESFLNLIKHDLSEWENGNFHKGYNVAVRVGGGYGDTVAAEPTVRYMSEHLYKDDNLIILTYLPEVFSHIYRPVYKMDAVIPDANQYYVVDTLISAETLRPIHTVVSAILCHACDYASITAIGMQLPIKNKRINLALDSNSLDSVKAKLGNADTKNMVLIHMGVSWPSKTIPDDVWQSYINALIEIGKTPILIGKDISLEIPNDFRGVAMGVDTISCIDLRNQLSFKELIAVVSMIPVLLSNDSVPVHIAGAFDNWIMLLATCKHPDYILPYRYESPYYKAKNLTKPLWDEFEARRNFIDGSNVDQIEEDKLRNCLPSPSELIAILGTLFN
jgi:hypothetical protein